MEYSCFKNAPLLETAAFVPKTVIDYYIIDINFNCVCTLHIFDRKPNQVGKIEKIVSFLRKEGPDNEFLMLMVAAHLINGPDNLNFDTTLDLNMLAGVIQNKIYMFCDSQKFERAHLYCYTVNKIGPNIGGNYLKKGVSGLLLYFLLLPVLSQKMSG